MPGKLMLTHPGHVLSLGTKEQETLHHTSQIHSWLGDPPRFSAHLTLLEKKVLAPTLRVSTCQNLNSSLEKKTGYMLDSLGLVYTASSPTHNYNSPSLLQRTDANVPPVIWSPQRNSSGNRSLITGNKALVGSSVQKKYGAWFASTEPELKPNIHLYPSLSNYISSVSNVAKTE